MCPAPDAFFWFFIAYVERNRDVITSYLKRPVNVDLPIKSMLRQCDLPIDGTHGNIPSLSGKSLFAQPPSTKKKKIALSFLQLVCLQWYLNTYS